MDSTFAPVGFGVPSNPDLLWSQVPMGFNLCREIT